MKNKIFFFFFFFFLNKERIFIQNLIKFHWFIESIFKRNSKKKKKLN